MILHRLPAIVTFRRFSTTVMSSTSTQQHPSLTDWVQNRLSAIYANETSESDLPTAINSSLSPSSEIMVNHSVVSRDKFVNDMTQFSHADPKANIEWKNITELPNDAEKPNEVRST
jgi:hypothetical protein